MATMTVTGGTWAGGADVPTLRLTRRGWALGILGLALVALAAVLLMGRLPRVEGAVAGIPASQGQVSVVVQPGESLWGIAEAVRPHADPRDVVAQIQAANGLRSNVIQPGSVLTVPVG